MLGRLQLTKLQKGKIATHCVQALFVFVALCVLIAMFVQNGHSDGRGKWYCAVAFLCIPAWVFLIMTPMWQRTVRFANAFALAAVDVVFTIFWFSAFIALAVWITDGEKQGAKDKKVGGSGNCTIFAYGNEKKCELAKAAVGLGAVIWLLWVASSTISVYFIIRWKKGEGLPWENAKPVTYQEPSSIEAQTKDAWSSDVNDHGDHESDDGAHTLRPEGQEEDEHQLLQSTETDDGRHPGQPWVTIPQPASYVGQVEHDYNYSAPTALSPAEYDQHNSYDSFRPNNYAYPGPDHQ
ncbi:hypothetical protein NA57DRAFT_61094 [Rhizodiscina lignyota]|uniref:MARVEL domain-containing protein n=1 Tax=Rhizodiscina lignyota TaxID=1504668 RepID=A0A9P4I2K7_9PEZI|nr:hypothetical protein NA57DRAFT_61094 [Rhizodiscina lignyota]